MQVCAVPPFAADSAQLGDPRWQPHDLLRLQRLAVLDGEPDWVREAITRAPFAVVRRALAAPGLVAIGVRGHGRAQRYGTWVEAADVLEAIAPEDFAASLPAVERRALPAFALLAGLRDDMTGLRRYAWGPTGSAGFELATRLPTVTMTSDLDLLIRTPKRLSHASAVRIFSELQTRAQTAGIRVDVQLETPAGGIALAEWAAGKARVMARQPRGPQLIADPWAAVSAQV